MAIVFFFFPLISNFYLFAIVLSVFAIAISLRSGAENSVIYESLLAGGIQWEGKTKIVFAIGSSLATLALGVASITGSFLMNISWHLVYWSLSVVMLIAGFIALSFHEVKYVQNGGSAHESVITKVRFYFKSKGSFRPLLFVSGVAFLFAGQTPFFVFSQPLLKSFGLAEHQVSLIVAGVLILSAFGTWVLSKFRFWEKRFFFYGFFVMVSGIFYLCSSTNNLWVVIVCLLSSSLIQGLISIYTEHYLNRVISSDIRATFLSLNFFIISLFSALSMPIYGKLIDSTGIQGVLSYYTLLPVLGLIMVYFFMDFQVETDHQQAISKH